MKGFTLIELIVVVAIIGVLSATALPTYRNYTIRTKISEVIMATNICRIAVTEASQTGFDSIPMTGNEFNCSSNSNKVAALTTNTNGVIKVQTQNIAQLDTRVTLELVPYRDAAMTDPTLSSDFVSGTSKEIRAWKCRPTQDAMGIDINYLPVSCR